MLGPKASTTVAYPFKDYKVFQPAYRVGFLISSNQLLATPDVATRF
jgi:hypothetical protein